MSAESAAPTTRKEVVAIVVGMVALFIAATVATQVGDLPEIEWRLQPGWLVLSLVLFVLGEGMHAELWRRLVGRAGGRLGVIAAWRMFTVSLLARYVPTQVLMAVTRVRMAQTAGVPRSITATTLVYEFALAFGAASAMSMAYLLALPELEDSAWRWLLLAVPLACLGLLSPRVIDLLVGRLAARLGVQSAHIAIPFTRLLGFLAAYVASFVVLGFGVYAFARGITHVGAPTVDAVCAFAIGYAGAVLAFFIPGGLGARDAATASALTTAMPTAAAIATAVGTRLLMTAVELAWAGATTLLERRRRAVRLGEDATLAPRGRPT